MKTLAKFAMVALIAMIATTVVAQEWTKEQKEVWQVVENSWMKWKAGDMDGAFAYLHPKFQGWSDDSPLPVNRETVVQWYKSMEGIQKAEGYQINPARIVVADNAAVVHYYFQYSVTYTMGEVKKHEKGEGKYVEFLVKEGGKWLCLGDMTVMDDGDDEKDDD